ncbi:cupredoxin domain-containing protein [Paenibacillus lupini]|uniref:cupredoxin domain-containing protein n=1 Tax=Paenibacillus lupini TaxID=1450204 RepID=UPI001FB9D757|nr:cupredoxin domain-containing protein [Paenibacillus lupini]NIK23572.1 plastocyanin domain-containing protein [Paenibacillus lupini]
MMKSIIRSKTTWLISVIFIICVLFFVLFYDPNGQSSVEAPAAVTEQDGYQVVTIQAKGDGFYPDHVEIKAGVPTKINFIKTTSLTCIRAVDSEGLGFDVYLKKGDNFTTLEDLKPGTYQFDCDMYMYHGTITVV